MSVRKTESRIPANLKLNDLGQVIVIPVVNFRIPSVIVDAISDFDRLGKTIEDNRNCFLFVFGT